MTTTDPGERYLDKADTLEDLVFQALGAASACWANLEGAGVFESDRAKAIGDELLERLRAHLGGYTKLQLLAGEMRANSERWFPQLHDGTKDLSVFYALGLAGEVGEVANVVKKMQRDTGFDVALYAGLAAELADVFVYLLLLADECGVDLLLEYRHKVTVNEQRWGNR